GLVQNDRLIGIALVSPPERRLEVTESWGWRWRMLLSAGRRATRRYLDFHAAVMACVPPGPHHLLPLFGVLPEYQGQGYGEQLLAALHDWCAQDPTSHGIVLDTGNHRYMAFYRRNGYQEIGEVHLGPVREHVFFHPNPQPLAGIPGSRGWLFAENSDLVYAWPTRMLRGAGWSLLFLLLAQTALAGQLRARSSPANGGLRANEEGYVGE